MRAMKLRLEPSDEYLHPLETASNFNESMYFNVYDPHERVGGFFRLGNRANEGYAEMTTCIYLPDGRVGFMFARPEIANNDAFDAGGMQLRGHRTVRGAAGDVHRQGRPARRAAADGASPQGVHREPLGRLRRPTSPTGASSTAFGGEPVNDDGSPLTEDLSGGFARGHYEQHVGARGVIRVGDEEWEVDGYGLRDHSWGPRYWQAPWYYRWLTMNFGEDAGFVVSVITARDGSERVGGVAFEDGEVPPPRPRRRSRPTGSVTTSTTRRCASPRSPATARTRSPAAC